MSLRFVRAPSAAIIGTCVAFGCGGPVEVAPPPSPPPPPPPPVAPVQVGTIPNQIVETGQTVTLDVASYFRDPDGGALTYTAAASAAGVVSVSMSGSTLTMVGVADGTASVTVTAGDPHGLTATQSFGVTVETPNRAPEAVGTIPDRTVETGRTATLAVASYFSDPDGDALTYMVASSAPAVISVVISGGTLTMVGVADGTARVTVTAGDPDGLTATQSFGVTVETPNRAPEAVGTIPDRTVETGRTAILDVASYFLDPDGDALTYTPSSSNAGVATATASGSAVTVGGVAAGAATITVTARDPDGLEVKQDFTITVTPPGPDLAFAGVTPASATLKPGDAATFTFQVRNQGTVASGATVIRAIRSTNPTISPRDTELQSYSLSPLAPAEGHAFPLTISVDASSAPGTIYIGMCIDPVTDESNTRNNCSEGARLTIAASSSVRGSPGGSTSVRIRAFHPRASRRPATQP